MRAPDDPNTAGPRQVDRICDEMAASRPRRQTRDIDAELVRARARKRLFGSDVEPVKLGKFHIHERLGRGGMGVVYKAYDIELDRMVALKLLRRDGPGGHGDHGTNDSAHQRLRREARALARLSHRNVVPVYDAPEIDGDVVVVMELVVGQTLRQWLGAKQRTWRELLDKYIAAAKGLSAAHRAGIVHRDFKPDNVLIGSDAEVRVADFGLARGTRDTQPPSDGTPPHGAESSPRGPLSLDVGLTVTGIVVGTAAYLAPECHALELADATADQFSFCVALYEGLFGTHPFAGDDIGAIIANIQSGAIIPPRSDREAPRWLREVVARGLAKNPKERWPSMAALIAALESDPARKRRQRRTALLIAAVVTTVILGLGWMARDAMLDSERRARDATRMEVAARFANDPTTQLVLFRGVENPRDTPGWTEAVSSVLRNEIAESLFEGHKNAVTAVAFSPDGQWLATASRDDSARLWRFGTLADPIVLNGHTNDLTALAFSPNGQLLATASDDGSARVWKTGSNEPPLTLEDHEGAVQSVAFDRDGQTIATASTDHTIRLWNADGTKRLGNADGTSLSSVLKGHGGKVNTVAFSMNGERRLITSSDDGMARIWLLDGTGASIPLNGHAGSVVSAAFSPDGALVVTASTDRTARIWSASHGRLVATLDGHGSRVTAALFSPDGTLVATASADNTARVWQSDGTGPVRELIGHSRAVTAVAFNHDSTRLATVSKDGTARLWDTWASTPAIVLRGHLGDLDDVAFSPDGKRVATAGAGDYDARIWSVRPWAKNAVFGRHSEDIRWVKVSSNGTRALTASKDDTVRIWTLDGSRRPVVLQGHTDDVYQAHFDLEGRRVLTASRDGTARIWNADDGREFVKIEAHDGAVTNALYDRSGTRVITGSAGGATRIWDAATGAKIRDLLGHENRIFRIELCIDDARILTLAKDDTARIWNIRTGAEIVSYPKQRGLYTGSCSPDGKHIATAADGGKVTIWRVDGGLVHELPGHSDTVASVRFSPDGTLLLTGSKDGTARLWSVKTGQEVTMFRTGGGQLNNNEFSPDGTRVLTGSLDGIGRMWDISGTSRPIVLSGHEQAINHGVFTPDGKRVLTVSRDGTLRLWRDLEPISDIGAALWQATTYCTSVGFWRARLGFDREQAQREHAYCRARVTEAYEQHRQ